MLVAGFAPAAELLPADQPIPVAIDHYVDAKLERSGVAPAPPADDYTLIRRLTLDLVGRIPTAPETRPSSNRPTRTSARSWSIG